MCECCTRGVSGGDKMHVSKKKKANSITRFLLLTIASKISLCGFMMTIRADTKISQCCIKLKLKELYKNVALCAFFFLLAQKR